MCHTTAKSWVNMYGLLWFWLKTDNTAYPAFSWGVAIQVMVRQKKIELEGEINTENFNKSIG